MFNLKNVYGVISFEEKQLKILITEQNNNEKNCLFYKSLDYSGYGKDHLIDIKEVEEILSVELLKIDSFMGSKVQRYMICDASLPIVINTSRIQNHEFSSEESIVNYLDNLTTDDSKTVLKNIITKYLFTDNTLLTSFPHNCSDFETEYISYIVDSNKLDQYTRLFSLLKIDIIGLFNNSFCYESELEQRKEKKNGYKLMIDICNDNAYLTFYNSLNKINKTMTVDFGLSYFKNMIKKVLRITTDEKIDAIAEIYQLIHDQDDNLPFINYHKNKYLTTQQLKTSALKSILHKQAELFLNSIISSLTETSFDEIRLVCNSSYNQIFKDTLKISNDNLVKNITIIEETIFGTENENITHMMQTITSAINQHQAMPNFNLSSIDPFVSEEISMKHAQQSLMIKFGLISTNIWAKLGTNK